MEKSKKKGGKKKDLCLVEWRLKLGFGIGVFFFLFFIIIIIGAKPIIMTY
jgi:hypothetical protein